jgi:hypothetical protein
MIALITGLYVHLIPFGRRETARICLSPFPEQYPSQHDVDCLFESKYHSVKVQNIALNTIDPLFVSNPVAPPGRVVGSNIAGTVDKVGRVRCQC